MSFWSRIKKNPKFYWAAGTAIGLTIFFFVDLAMYYGVGPEATLSATLREVLAVDQKSIYIAFGGFLIGVWFSHVFQFAHKPPGEEDEKKNKSRT